jgi:hypothetical protein
MGSSLLQAQSFLRWIADNWGHMESERNAADFLSGSLRALAAGRFGRWPDPSCGQKPGGTMNLRRLTRGSADYYLVILKGMFRFS